MECRSNEEVCHVLPHGELTNASQMSTSVPLSLSWHPLSHPIASRTHCHLPPHSNPPRLRSVPLLTHLPAHQHMQPEPYCTPHTTGPQREQRLSTPHPHPPQHVPQHAPLPPACPQPCPPAILPLHIQPHRRSHL